MNLTKADMKEQLRLADIRATQLIKELKDLEYSRDSSRAQFESALDRLKTERDANEQLINIIENLSIRLREG